MGSVVTAKRKTNAKFMFLSALGIMMVVDSHCWGPLNLFSSLIPYNSFYMPLFIFISGYFNKVDEKTDLKKYVVKKIRTLLVPYVVIVFAGYWLEWLLDWYKRGEPTIITAADTLDRIKRIFTDGAPVNVSYSMWFIPMMFVLLVMYALIKKVFAKHWNTLIMFLVFTLGNIAIVWIAKNTFVSDYVLLVYKTVFFLPFLELGVLYRERIEPKLAGLSKGGNMILLALLLLINVIRMMILPEPYDVAFNDIATLTGFTSPFVVTPMISSLIGILFWVTIADFTGPALGDNRVVNYISENTIWLMGFHLVFFNILNCVLLTINNNIVTLPEFYPEMFKTMIGYRWEHYAIFRIVYFAVGMTGPLLMKLAWDKIMSGIRNKKAA